MATVEDRFTVGDPENGFLAGFPRFQQALNYASRHPADAHCWIYDVMAHKGCACEWNQQGEPVDYRRD